MNCLMRCDIIDSCYFKFIDVYYGYYGWGYDCWVGCCILWSGDWCIEGYFVDCMSESDSEIRVGIFWCILC